MDSTENLGPDVPIGAKNYFIEKSDHTDLNAGSGDPCAGQTRFITNPVLKLCSWAVITENFGIELPIGSVTNKVSVSTNLKLGLGDP